ncbi:probable serine/threonine-protein kinase pats1 [Mytilus californianus]|uniref:probable serine/threonine-protein kinase pats1 n=1 Tax=Mytilus californianus TaxID=6549 RepID=UPI0022481B1B|nr:probable serine/threonine-protein kinase pats1 [Mytilus californianus]
MTSAIIQPFIYQKESKMQDMLASCWLLDFAGQKEFYATHQVFLSSVAVFVLVTDSLECITGETTWKGFKESASYVRFWIDVIHCYWSSRETEGRLDPPIIVVCTNTDKYKDKSERQKQQRRFIEYLCEVLFKQDKKDHLRKVYFVSNTDDADDVFETIRKDISSQAIG